MYLVSSSHGMPNLLEAKTRRGIGMKKEALEIGAKGAADEA